VCVCTDYGSLIYALSLSICLTSHFPRPLTIPASELCRALITNPS